ncbi:MAG: Pycsar system effector family protein [Frankia sp.]
MAGCLAAGCPAADDARTRYSRRLLAEAREERVLADAKASLLFAAVGVAATIMSGAAVGRIWSPFRLSPAAAAAWWTGAAAMVAGVVLLAAAIYPRISNRRHWSATTVSFFADVARCSDINELRCALERSANNEFARISEQLLTLGRLTARKYGLIKASLWAIATTTALDVASLVLERLHA